jgi:hypothetical protein
MSIRFADGAVALNAETFEATMFVVVCGVGQLAFVFSVTVRVIVWAAGS